MADASPHELSIEDLAVLMVGELHRAMQSSELEQARLWTASVATVGATEEGHVAKALGMTPEERAATASAYAESVVLPILLEGRKASRIVTFDATGRDYLLRAFAGLEVERPAERGTPQAATIEALLQPTRDAARPWSIDRVALLGFVQVKLIQEARESYRLLRAAVQRGIPHVHVTGGELVAKVSLSVAANPNASKAGPGSGRASVADRLLAVWSWIAAGLGFGQAGAAAVPAARASTAAGPRSDLRILAQVVDARSDAAIRSSAAVGSMRLEFRVGNFPEMRAP